MSLGSGRAGYADLENARAARTAAQAQIAKATVTFFDAKRDLERKENLGDPFRGRPTRPPLCIPGAHTQP